MQYELHVSLHEVPVLEKSREFTAACKSSLLYCIQQVLCHKLNLAFTLQSKYPPRRTVVVRGALAGDRVWIMHRIVRSLLDLTNLHPGGHHRRRHNRVFSKDDVIDKDDTSSFSDGQFQKLLQLLHEQNITFEELIAQRKLTTSNVGTLPTTITTTTITTTTRGPLTPLDGDPSGHDVSWGLILPIVFVGLFLICVAACLYWHNWRDKRRLQGEATVPNLSLSTFSRTNPSSDEWKTDLRCSTRSTTPLRLGGRDTSSLHPMAFHNSLSDSLSTSRSSYSTNAGTSFCRDDHERHVHNRRQLSPIDEVGPYVSKLLGSNVASVSQYEGCISAQGVYPPYHLTWVSPQAVTLNMRPGDINNNSRAIVETSFYRSAKSSPFFPNNNTPTTDCDGGPSRASPSSTIINPPSNTAQGCYNNMGADRYPSSEISTDSSYTDASGGTAIGAVSSLDYQGSIGNRKCPSDAGSDSSSLPSSINPFRMRNNGHPPEHRHTVPSYGGTMPQTTFTEPLASSIDSYTSSDNTSLYPNVGSSVNTTSHPLSLPSYPISLAQSEATTPSQQSRGDDVFDTAITIVDGEPKTCLLNGDVSSMASMETSNIATALFRSWSANAELDYTAPFPSHAAASPMSAPPGGNPFSPRNPREVTDGPEARVVIGGNGHNNLDKSQSNNRHVVFQNIPPVLDSRKHWL